MNFHKLGTPFLNSNHINGHYKKNRNSMLGSFPKFKVSAVPISFHYKLIFLTLE